jgi:serine/threonine protein kinase
MPQLYDVSPFMLYLEAGTESLCDRIQRGAYSVQHVDYWIRALLEHMRACHQRGIFHLDLKPANMVLTRTDELLVVDWGSTLIAGAPRDPVAVLTTCWYRPPETWVTPEPAFSLDAYVRMNIWSLGCIVHDMIRREPLLPKSEFCAAYVQQRLGSLQAYVVPPHQEHLYRFMRACLQWTPEERPSLEHLSRILADRDQGQGGNQEQTYPSPQQHEPSPHKKKARRG